MIINGKEKEWVLPNGKYPTNIVNSQGLRYDEACALSLAGKNSKRYGQPLWFYLPKFKMKFENNWFQRRQSKVNFRKRKPARKKQKDSNIEKEANLIEVILN